MAAGVLVSPYPKDQYIVQYDSMILQPFPRVFEQFHLLQIAIDILASLLLLNIVAFPFALLFVVVLNEL